MSKSISLCTGKVFDTENQVLTENQIVVHHNSGCMRTRYVVYRVEHKESGYIYHLIDLKTKEFSQTDIVQPLHEAFGIGMYYNALEPEFMDACEVAILQQQAEQLAKEQQEAKKQGQERKEQLNAAGRERLKTLLPKDAQAVIIAEEHEDESNPMTDYFGFRTLRTVILGFSAHKRDLFSEMRKAAANFEGTQYLAEKNEKYENREKYSMGGGYYLGKSRNSGWIVKKIPIYDMDRFLDNYAFIAGNAANIYVSEHSAVETAGSGTVAGDFIIVAYSEKAIAVFGDTKPIKDQLMALGGRFNKYLSHDGQKQAGWIFSKSKEQEIRNFININE
jgi:hypothetical protein